MNITTLNLNTQNSTQQINSWIDVRKLKAEHNLTEQYADICQQHELNKKWILMINPEDDYLDKLAEQNNVDTSKILKVNTRKTKLNIKNVESALCKGNCSAVILCNPSLKKAELSQLKISAEKGKTPCIVLTHNKTIH